MTSVPIAIYTFLCSVLGREDGQDLVEYALIFAVISLGSVSGMGFLAAGINNEFSSVATVLSSNIQ
jgi:pilus assembly protein Flp/PilA